MKKTNKPLYLRRILLLALTLIPIMVLIAGEFTYRLIKPTSWTAYTVDNSNLLDRAVSTIFVTPDGVWVGTGEGLNLIGPDGSWKSYTPQNSPLRYNRIHSLEMDRSHNLWIGQESGIIVLGPGETWLTYPISFFNTKDKEVTYLQALTIDQSDRVWVGTTEGLFALADGRIQANYTEDNSDLLDNSIWSLHVDNAETLWIGTNHGLNALNLRNDTWSAYTEDQLNMREAWVHAIAADDQGQMWIGTDTGGASRLSSDGTWHTYTSGNSELGHRRVHAIAVDQQNRVWLGTEWGLNVVESNGDWRTYTVARSGLSDSTIRGLVIDERNRLWIGTRNGVNVINLQPGLPATLPRWVTDLRTTIRRPLGVGYFLFAMVDLNYQLTKDYPIIFGPILLLLILALLLAIGLVAMVWWRIFNGTAWRKLAGPLGLLVVDVGVISGLIVISMFGALMIAIIND